MKGYHELYLTLRRPPNLSGKGNTFQLRVRESLSRKKLKLEFPLRDKKWRAVLRVGCLGDPDFQSPEWKKRRQCVTRWRLKGYFQCGGLSQYYAACVTEMSLVLAC